MLGKTRLEVQNTKSCTLSSRCRVGARNVRCHAGVAEQQQQQQQQSAAAATASIRQLLTRRSYAPPRYVGPIEVSQVPGRPHSQLPLPLMSNTQTAVEPCRSLEVLQIPCTCVFAVPLFCDIHVRLMYVLIECASIARCLVCLIPVSQASALASQPAATWQ
jgi:hypothetical protein